MNKIYQQPKSLLFEELFPLRNGEINTLFKSQKALAEAISSDESSDYYQKESSLKPFLNQVLKPSNEHLSKPIPEKLIISILKACEEKLADNDKYKNNFKEKFIESIHFWKSLNIRDKEKIDSWEELQEWQESSFAFIFTHSPVELHWSKNKKAYKLVSQLYNLALDIKNLNKICNYRFFFPNEIIAINFWKSLYLFLKNEIKLNHLKILELLNNSWDNKTLRVYIVENEIFEFHSVYFEKRIDQTTISNSALFFFELRDINEISIYKFSDNNKEYWYYNKFQKIVPNIDLDIKIKKIKFIDSYAYSNLF